MAIPVIMPRQGQSVETCFITGWYKSKGDTVIKGDVLFSYETDKAAFDQEANEDGILLDVFFDEGDEVPVLETVAVIGTEGENYESLRPGGGKGPEASRDSGPSDDSVVSPDSPETMVSSPEDIPGSAWLTGAGGPVSEDTPPEYKATGGSGEKLRVSPLARKMARDQNLLLTEIKGTGPHGRIIERDIKRAAEAVEAVIQPVPSPEEVRTEEEVSYKSKSPAPGGPKTGAGSDFNIVKVSNMRRIIAGKMHQSLQNSAQLTHHMSADARKLLAWRKEIKSETGKAGHIDISINDMVCMAVIKALRKHPSMNAHFLGNEIRLFNKVHLGIAVDTERGLMVPALRDADDMNIGGLSRNLKELAESCKKGNIDPELLSSESASFTVSNLGAYGVEMFTPVLNLPQTGILGVNNITYRPADLGEGIIGFIPVIGLSLTYDHRAIDGAPASVFLGEVKKEIENISNYR
jgi:pyruvate dehydrogenase E2 component (dihydrolipoamide acetyltransferase)